MRNPKSEFCIPNSNFVLENPTQSKPVQPSPTCIFHLQGETLNTPSGPIQQIWIWTRRKVVYVRSFDEAL
jgi:hypothetical protein